MPIVLISRGSYRKGKEVAEQVARELGYKCIAREILIEASRKYNVPEIKLVRAIDDAPSILERLSYRKEEYVAYIQAVLLRQLQQDNIVYHGNAGPFFVKHVSHVLKVRITADMEERVQCEMEQEGISRRRAQHLLEKDDLERRKWGLHLYGMDPADPNLYDLVICIRKAAIDVQQAVSLICRTVASARYQATPESQKHLENQLLAAEIRGALIGWAPDAEVVAEDGAIDVETDTLRHQKEIRRIVESISGVTSVSFRESTGRTPRRRWHRQVLHKAFRA